MGVTLEIRVTGGEGWVRRLRGVRDRLANRGQILKAFGVHMLRSVRRNFDEQGRPQRWAPISPGYAAALRARGRAGKILQRSGAFLTRIQSRVEGDTLRIGTSVPWAPIHQFGGTIQVPEVRPVRAKALRWYSPAGTPVFAKFARAHSVMIPARPFLLLHDEDLDILVAMMEQVAAPGPGEGG